MQTKMAQILANKLVQMKIVDNIVERSNMKKRKADKLDRQAIKLGYKKELWARRK